MLFHCHVVEEDVVLGTEPQAAADQDHVLGDLVAIDVGLPACGGVQTCGEQDTAAQGGSGGKEPLEMWRVLMSIPPPATSFLLKNRASLSHVQAGVQQLPPACRMVCRAPTSWN